MQALTALETIRGKTGLIFDKRMAEHHCLWDKNHPECPERFTRVVERYANSGRNQKQQICIWIEWLKSMHSIWFRCDELKLIDRCHQIDPRDGTLPEILLKHTQDQFDLLKSTENETDNEKLEELSSHYDGVYFHPVSSVP